MTRAVLYALGCYRFRLTWYCIVMMDAKVLMVVRVTGEDGDDNDDGGDDDDDENNRRLVGQIHRDGRSSVESIWVAASSTFQQ